MVIMDALNILTSICFSFTLLFQQYEWLSIERVISNEKDLSITKLHRSYKDQNLIKNKFNKQEVILKYLAMAAAMIVMVHYLYAEILNAMNKFKNNQD